MKALLLVLAAAFFVSCAKFSVDNTDPEIEVLLIDGQGSITGMNAGESVALELFVSDDENLYEVLVKFENISNLSLTPAQSVVFIQVFTGIDAKQFSETIQLTTDPEDLAGKYRLLVQVVDLNGNADSRVLEWSLFNPGNQPEINVTGFYPTLSGETLIVQAGDSLKIYGDISDASGINQFTVSLSGQSVLSNQIVDLEGGDFQFYDLNWFGAIQISESAMSGNYNLNISASDTEGHMSFYEQSVAVSP